MKNKILILFLALALFVTGLNTHVSAKENFIYIVQKNDTISKISEMLNVASNDIILHNKQIINPNLLIKGEYVNIPNVDNNTFGVLYKQEVSKNEEKTVAVSNFNYENTTFSPTEYEKEVVEKINAIRKIHKRTPLNYDETLSVLAKNEVENLINKDIKNLQNKKNILKKLSFYNIDYKYAGQLSLMGQENPTQIVEIINQSALNDYVINPDFSDIGLYIVSLNNSLYTTLYFT